MLIATLNKYIIRKQGLKSTLTKKTSEQRNLCRNLSVSTQSRKPFDHLLNGKWSSHAHMLVHFLHELAKVFILKLSATLSV